MKYFLLPLMACGLIACSAEGGQTALAQEANASMSLPPLSGDYVWTPDYSQSALTFDAVHNGDEFTGEFETFEAAIRLNPDDLSNASIFAIVDLSSADARDSDRNGALRTKEWFNIKAYPKAVFRSDIITKTGDGYIARGDLSIKGQTQEIDLPFTLNIDGRTANASGQYVMNRTDFGLGNGEYTRDESWVKYSVTVNVDIVATR